MASRRRFGRAAALLGTVAVGRSLSEAFVGPFTSGPPSTWSPQGACAGAGSPPAASFTSVRPRPGARGRTGWKAEGASKDADVAHSLGGSLGEAVHTALVATCSVALVSVLQQQAKSNTWDAGRCGRGGASPGRGGRGGAPR
ncbi:unnamed protein product [Polarella glacialis]|uniref:Uncharacterized protein n=1 Tax=Polarella glacialis TaxID=89957 RepID=A0A813KRU0_POLGL|nr:unnamed protein product [Polarella glacialis]